LHFCVRMLCFFRMEEQKKLRIGWFSFSCCEDSTILFTEILNDHYAEWLPKLEIVHARVLQTKNTMAPMDVAFIEGAVASDEQAEKVKEIRKLATKVVAIGACAVTGMPSSQRNSFDEKTNEEIQFLKDRFQYADKVRKLDEVITVDVAVPGCPMVEAKFLEAMDAMFREFGIAPKGEQGL